MRLTMMMMEMGFPTIWKWTQMAMVFPIILMMMMIMMAFLMN